MFIMKQDQVLIINRPDNELLMTCLIGLLHLFIPWFNLSKIVVKIKKGAPS